MARLRSGWLRLPQSLAELGDRVPYRGARLRFVHVESRTASGHQEKGPHAAHPGRVRHAEDSPPHGNVEPVKEISEFCKILIRSHCYHNNDAIILPVL